MNSRARIQLALARRPADRLPLCETTIWPQTIRRWQAEGLPTGVDLNEYFGLDPLVCINDLFDPSFGLTEITLEQTGDYRVYVDRYGKTIKELQAGSGSPPVVLEPAIRSRADWEKRRALLTPADGKFNHRAAEDQFLPQRVSAFPGEWPPGESRRVRAGSPFVKCPGFPQERRCRWTGGFPAA